MEHRILLTTLLSVFVTASTLRLPLHAQSENTSNAKNLEGRIVTEQIHSPALESALLSPSTDRSVSVYLPALYDELPDASFPVVYLLHAWWDEHWQFIDKIGGKPTLDAFFSLAGVQPMIVVFPNAYYQLNGSWYTNSYVAGNWEDFVTNDLVSHIDSTYRTIPEAASRGIGGLNTGGYAAIKMAMEHGGLFQAVYGLSSAELEFEDVFLTRFRSQLNQVAANPSNFANFSSLAVIPKIMVGACIAFAPDSTASPIMCNFPVDENGSVVDSVWQEWLRHDPYTLLSKPENKQNLLDLRGLEFDCGTRATYVINANRRFAEALTDAGIPHDYHEYAGADADGLAGRMRNAVLPFFSEMLTGQGIFVSTDDPIVPDGYRLSQNYPNPFNPSTTITYDLPRAADVRLTVYDGLGRIVETIGTWQLAPGRHAVRWEAKGLTSGVYFVRMQAGDFVETKALILAE